MNQTELIEAYASFCEWAPVTLGFFSDNVFDPLIYYSHFVPILLSLPLALIVFLRAPQSKLNQYFFTLVGLFTLWTAFDLLVWSQSDPALIMFFWSLLILIEPLIYFVALLFAYNALYKKRPPIYISAITSILLLPIIVLLPTSLAIESFNLTNCWREVTEGPLVFYGYFYQAFLSLLIVLFTLLAFKTRTAKDSSGIYISLGILSFLSIFTLGNFVGSWLGDWTIGQYGLFGMPIMVAFIGYVISRYQTFNTKIISTELLVGALSVLLLSLLLIEYLPLLRAVVVFSFGLMLCLGYLLIRSVRVEHQQRTKLESLTRDLEKANVKLKKLDRQKSEFVSIASHQLRSPLTSIRGYASMLLEGSFGTFPPKAKESIERIEASAKHMTLAVEDYLNVSRIEAGNMKYELSDFNLKTEIEYVCDDVRSAALKKGLILLFRTDLRSRCIVNADLGKTVQIAHNLINNSIKYTPKGTITVFVRDDVKAKRIYVDVIDTGIGMSENTLQTIFQKFSRAEDANKVNVHGTGLGLFVADKMAEAMGGDITAHSAGEGKGSRFTLELPLMM